MTKLVQRILNSSAAISMLLAFAAPLSAQDFGTAMLFGLGKSALSEGEELLNEAPDRLEEFLQSTERGQLFPSATECLGALQLAVNAGAVVANVLPFSSVETFEDKRGPVAKFRVMLNGEKVHLEAFCDDEKMSAVPLSWGDGSAAPEKVTRSSLDAVAGLLLLLHAQGAFDNVPDTISDDRNVQDTIENLLPPLSPQPRKSPIQTSVQKCWNVSSLSSEALRTRVVVAVELDQGGRPYAGSLRMLSYVGGSSEAARQMFESARRAIIRCGANGFALPDDWSDSNKEVILTFDPQNIRIR